jgi:hypothetical protein
MEDGLSDRALKVLRAALHEKAGMLLARRVISLLYRIWTLSGPADSGKPAARGFTA